MAPRYNIAADFGGPDGLISYSPRWVLGVVRFANQNTFDLSTGQSVSQDSAFAMSERTPLVISNAINVQTDSSKEAHVSGLQATLLGDRNYLSAIMTGDWLVCCMLSSDDEGRRVAKAMQDKKPINGWSDGLKFVGRVHSVRKSVQVEPGSGVRQTIYSVQCVGFGEFDQSLFYHPALQRNRVLPEAMAAFGTLLENVVKGQGGTTFENGLIDINRIIPQLLTAIFGKGAWSGDNPSTVGGQTASPNKAYLVPQTVGAWLGINVRTYADLIRPMLGVQHYRISATATNNSSQSPWSLFRPDSLTSQDGVLRTNNKLLGLFLPAPPQYSTTVWNLLETYRAHPINEMFLTLRAIGETGPDGKEHGVILPHLIVRQNPYSTDAKTVADVLFRDANDEEFGDPSKKGSGEAVINEKLRKKPNTVITTKRTDFTDFLELPRWVMDSKLLQGMDIGRSEAPRFNYVHLTGVGIQNELDQVGSYVRAPPNVDELDIERSGLRPYMTSLSCMGKGTDIYNGLPALRDLMTDIVVGGHLMLSGTISTYGILSPIAVGDNLEFENVVYHIEQITHSCSISPSGGRSWTTNLSVSHGVLIETARNVEQGRSGAFAGTNEEQDLVTYLPATEENDLG